MRIPNLGGKVPRPGGATRRSSPRAPEIYAALERGVIDASEFVGLT